MPASVFSSKYGNESAKFLKISLPSEPPDTKTDESGLKQIERAKVLSAVNVSTILPFCCHNLMSLSFEAVATNSLFSVISIAVIGFEIPEYFAFTSPALSHQNAIVSETARIPKPSDVNFV